MCFANYSITRATKKGSEWRSVWILVFGFGRENGARICPATVRISPHICKENGCLWERRAEGLGLCTLRVAATQHEQSAGTAGRRLVLPCGCCIGLCLAHAGPGGGDNSGALSPLAQERCDSPSSLFLGFTSQRTGLFFSTTFTSP